MAAILPKFGTSTKRTVQYNPFQLITVGSWVSLATCYHNRVPIESFSVVDPWF